MNKTQALAAFDEYVSHYDPQNPMIALKIAHTYRVASLAERIAKSLEQGEEISDFAWLLGLLHDIGRFEQVRQYGTFMDAKSVDHAEFGADLLFSDHLIDRFPAESLPEGWLQITTDGIPEGYVSGDYVSKTAPSGKPAEETNKTDKTAKKKAEEEKAEKEKAEKETAKAEDKDGDEGSKKVVIDVLTLNNIKIKYGMVTIPVPSITLKDLGKDSDGLTVSELFEQIWNAVLKAAYAVGDGAKVLGGVLMSGAEMLGEGAGKAVDAVSDGAGKAVDAVSDGAGKAVDAVKDGAGKAADAIKGLFN